MGADTLARHVFAPDFFTHVPELVGLQTDFEHCREHYKTETKKKGCSCRVSSEWMRPCITKLLDMLAGATRTDHTLIRKFIRAVAKKGADEAVDHLAVTIVYNQPYDIFVDTTLNETG
jgi:hypothetical protein